MACATHGTGMACCCAGGVTTASFRRCPTPDDWFLQSSPMRGVLTAGPHAPVAPPLAGFLAILTLGLFLRIFPERPDPVPKLPS